MSKQPGAFWKTGLAAFALALGNGVPLVAQAQDAEGHELHAAAARLELGYGKRTLTGADVQAKISAPVRAALNDWADAVTELGLTVAVPRTADALVLGTLGSRQMREVAGWLDEAWELMAPVLAGDEARWSDATLVFVFDEQGSRSPAWEGMLDQLVTRHALPAAARNSLARDPGGLTLRDVPAFLQPSWDMAGNAAAGDDEFRLGNEIVHKFVQCLVTERFGQLPEMLRWGMGYVAEQRLFRSIYQFDATGFVSADAHVQWPKRTAKTLKAASRKDDFSLAAFARGAGAGQAQVPQMVTWAALDYLNQRQPEELAGLLSELGELHRAADSWRNPGKYSGDRLQTGVQLAALFDAIDSKLLLKHLKRVK
jgi:hypothetical protein